jgi:hypothetical protein
MRLTAPSKAVFLVAMIIAIVTVVSVLLAVAGVFMVPFVVAYSFCLMVAAFVVLALGVTLRGF